MKSTITIELTDEQINKIVKSHQPSKPLTYSIREASRVIGISEATIRRMIKENFISTVIMIYKLKIENKWK